jgi:uncharacterized protein (TIGR03086 family)
MHPLDLLRASIEIAGQAVEDAAPDSLDVATPCREWSLAVLVRHVADSAASLGTLLTARRAGPPPLPGCSAAQAALTELRGAVEEVPADDPAARLVAVVGSFELVLHGWDVGQATGRTAAVPPRLVEALLVRAPVVLPDGARSGLFAPVIVPDAGATDLERLVGLFGRTSGWRA